jgi:uncharacterized protein YgiM (DUF1202 family)
MKILRGMWLLLGVLAMLSMISGCTVTAGPMIYVPPPACPEGFYYAAGYGCLPLPTGVVLPPDAVFAVVNTEGLSLRSCGSTRCDILNSLSAGEQVQVLGHEGGWTRVWAFTRGQEGWVASRYLD